MHTHTHIHTHNHHHLLHARAHAHAHAHTRARAAHTCTHTRLLNDPATACALACRSGHHAPRHTYCRRACTARTQADAPWCGGNQTARVAPGRMHAHFGALTIVPTHAPYHPSAFCCLFLECFFGWRPQLFRLLGLATCTWLLPCKIWLNYTPCVRQTGPKTYPRLLRMRLVGKGSDASGQRNHGAGAVRNP